MKKRLLIVVAAIIAVGVLAVVLLSHNHTYSDKYEFDNEQHWLECQGEKCEEKQDLSAHAWDEGRVVTSATHTAEGVFEHSCTVCDATKQVPIEKLLPSDGSIAFVDGFKLGKTYDGAVVAVKAESYMVVGDGEVSVEWYSGSQKLESAPVLPGTYSVKLILASTAKYNGAQTSHEFVIAKRSANISFVQDFALDKAYDGTPVSVDSDDYTVVGDGVVAVEWYCGDEKLASEPTLPGEYTLKIVIATSKLYNRAEKTLDFVISKGDGSVEFAQDLNLDKVYDGTPLTIENDDYTVVGDGAVTLEWYKGTEKLESAPTASGEYSVKIVLSEGENYNGAEDTLDFVISKADGSIEFAQDLNLDKVYDGAPLTIENDDYTVVGDGTVTFEWYKGTEKLDGAPTVLGEYSVKIVLSEGENYNGAENTLDFVISRADGSVKFAQDLNLDKVYDGTPVTIENDDYTVVGDGTVTFEWYKGTEKLDGAPTVLGEYSVKIILSEGQNYNGAEASLEFSIVSLIVEPGSIKIDGADELENEFCYVGGVSLDLKYTGEYATALGIGTVEYASKTSEDVSEWAWTTTVPTEKGKYAARIYFEGNEAFKSTYTDYVVFEIGDHVIDFKGECVGCDLSYLQKIELGTKFNIEYEDSTTIYYYLDTEIGQMYEIVRNEGDSSRFYFYNEDGTLVGNQTIGLKFIAEYERYYIVCSMSSKPTSAMTVNEYIPGYRQEGVVVHELKEGETLNVTITSREVWLKIDNTSGKYDKYMFIGSDPWGYDESFSLEGMFQKGWTSTGTSKGYENRIDFSDFKENNVIYYMVRYSEEMVGKSVSFNLLKPVSKMLSKNTTINIEGDEYITADGYAYLELGYSYEKVYGISGDLATIEVINKKSAEYLGEKDGVHYYRSNTTFDMCLVIKIQNREGSLLITEHTEHFDYEDGKCICGEVLSDDSTEESIE